VTPVPINRPMVRDFLPNRNLIEDLQTIRPSRRVWLGAWVLSLLNWTLDVACLAASCAALGVHVSVPALLLTYTAGMAASSLTALPGGVGVVEAALIVGLTTAGAPLAAALGAVLVYRVLSLGGVVVIGWGVLAVHRLRTRPAITATAGRTPIRCSVLSAGRAQVVPPHVHEPPPRVQPSADPRRCADRQRCRDIGVVLASQT